MLEDRPDITTLVACPARPGQLLAYESGGMMCNSTIVTKQYFTGNTFPRARRIAKPKVLIQAPTQTSRKQGKEKSLYCRLWTSAPMDIFQASS